MRKRHVKRYGQILHGTSYVVLAFVLGVIAFAQWHDSSLPAAATRVLSRVQAYGEPKPYEAHVFIPMTFDRQDHALSCEVATLKMVLNHKGVVVDENELIAHMGFDRTSHTWTGGQEFWGDPSVSFVGDIDGRMMHDGYGVYWQPIARVANVYRSAVSFEGWDVRQLVRTLQDGNPVIVWGCLGGCEHRTWLTPDGKPVIAVTYEHTFVVNGFNGDPDGVTGFWLIDPIYGRKYMELGAFVRMWDAFGRSGVLVR